MTRLQTISSSLLIAIVAGIACYATAPDDGGDFSWAIRIFQDLIHGVNTYDQPFAFKWAPYPLPVAVFGIPSLVLPPRMLAACFLAGSSGLLAFAMLSKGNFSQLLLFASPFYVMALATVQWSPLINVGWFFPNILPLMLLVKPQITLPYLLLRRRDIAMQTWIASGGVLLVSWLILPWWPLYWLRRIGTYQAVIPVVLLWGLPLILLRCYRRNQESRFLFWLSIFPHRGPYDLTGVCLCFPTWRAAVYFMIGTWVLALIPLLNIHALPTWVLYLWIYTFFMMSVSPALARRYSEAFSPGGLSDVE